MQEAAVPDIPGMVSIDLGSLRGETLPDQGTRYTVDLLGPVDGRWLRSFRALQQNVDVYARYRLDVDGRSISFDMRAGDGSDRIIHLIERLVELVGSVGEGALAGEETGRAASD
jgi:hypothetical protein